MKPLWALLNIFKAPESDLSWEEIEELHMLTGFTSKELKAYRLSYLNYVEGSAAMTSSHFLGIPAIAINPLRDRLLACFGLTNKQQIAFQEYMEVLAVFNSPSAPREQKLQMAMTLHDFDGDGKVSKADLVQYLACVTAPPEGTKLDLEAIADHILEEASSDPTHRFLSSADFQRVLLPTDFEAKLVLPI